MIKVDVKGLKSEIDLLNSLIDEYETTQMNLFNALKNSCSDWNDGYSIQFEERIAKEKKESQRVINNLRDKKRIYNYIYEKYSELGNRIKCNLDSKDSLLYSIDSVYNNINNIVNNLYYVEADLYYCRNKMVDARNNISAFRNNINNIFNTISNIENIVNKKIKELEAVKISDFEFNYR